MLFTRTFKYVYEPDRVGVCVCAIVCFIHSLLERVHPRYVLRLLALLVAQGFFFGLCLGTAADTRALLLLVTTTTDASIFHVCGCVYVCVLSVVCARVRFVRASGTLQALCQCGARTHIKLYRSVCVCVGILCVCSHDKQSEHEMVA